MPRYTYRCTHCDIVQDIFHLADEKPEGCHQCKRTENLIKILSTISTRRVASGHAPKVGAVTEEFIQTAREELAQQKEGLINK